MWWIRKHDVRKATKWIKNKMAFGSVMEMLVIVVCDKSTTDAMLMKEY